MSTYRRPKSVTRLNRTRSGNLFPDRSADDIEEVPAGAVFDFENPKIGVKLRLPRQIVFDFRVRCGLRSQARRKDAIGGARLKRTLRRGSKQLRRSIQPADAHENRTCFFGAAPTHDSGTTFDLAASQIGRNPQGTLEAHRLRSFLKSGFSSIPTILASGRFSRNERGRLIDWVPDHRSEFFDQAVGNATASWQVVVALELRDRGTCRIVQYSGRFDWTVAVFGQSSLHGGDPRRWTDQFGNRVVAPGRDGLRRGGCDRTRGRAGYKRFERIGFCRRRFGVEERRRVRAGLQEDGLHDNDKSCRDRGDGGDRIYRAPRYGIPGPKAQGARPVYDARNKRLMPPPRHARRPPRHSPDQWWQSPLKRTLKMEILSPPRHRGRGATFALEIGWRRPMRRKNEAICRDKPLAKRRSARKRTRFVRILT